MAARIVPIIGVTTFTSNLQASQTSIIPIGPRTFNSMDAVSGVLSVRIYALSLQGGGTVSSIDVGLWNALITPEYPTATLYDANSTFTSGAWVAGHNYDSTINPIPRLFTHGFNLGVNAQLAVILKFIQGTTAGANSITLSADVILRDA